MANLIAGQLGYRFVTQFIDQLSKGRFIESIQTISPLELIAAMLSPYVHCVSSAPPRMAAGNDSRPRRNPASRSWETKSEHGLPIRLRTSTGWRPRSARWRRRSVAAGYDITVVTCRIAGLRAWLSLRIFSRSGGFELPEYELQRLSFPPLLPDHGVSDSGELFRADHQHPGPVGLSAFYAAKTLGLRAVGIYHTDFPQYVRILTR